MSRRRGLMATANRPLFELTNTTVTRGQSFSSGVSPFKSNEPCTILIDFTNTENPTTTPADRWKLLRCYDEALNKYPVMAGKATATTAYFTAWFYKAANDPAEMVIGANPEPHRHRLLFVHDANSNSATIMYKADNETISTIILSSTYSNSDAILTFGGPANGGHSLPAGTINLAQVWDRVLSTEEINAFFA